ATWRLTCLSRLGGSHICCRGLSGARSRSAWSSGTAASAATTTETTASTATARCAGGARDMIDGDVERCTSLHIPKIRIAAMLQEELRNVVIVVVQRNHHRRVAFGRGQIHIGACTDKRLDARHATTTGCVQKRRQTAIRVILCARLRGNLAW